MKAASKSGDRSNWKKPLMARSEAGLTWLELLVCILVLAVLIALAFPGGATSTMKKGQMTQMLSNMKQLQLATQQMVLDGETTGDKSLGWPGDTGGTFANWTRKLVPAYLGTNDLCKMLSAPGIAVPVDKIPTSMSQTAVLVYAVSSNSPSNAVLLTTANFTNGPYGGTPPGEKSKPYGNKGFIVFRKGGDGMILQKRQAAETNLIGSYVPLLR